MTLAERRHLYRSDPFYHQVVDALVFWSLNEEPPTRFWINTSIEFWALQVCYLGRDESFVSLLDPFSIEACDEGWSYQLPDGSKLVFPSSEVLILEHDQDLAQVRSSEDLDSLDKESFRSALPRIKEFIGGRQPYPD